MVDTLLSLPSVELICLKDLKRLEGVKVDVENDNDNGLIKMNIGGLGSLAITWNTRSRDWEVKLMSSPTHGFLIKKSTINGNLRFEVNNGGREIVRFDEVRHGINLYNGTGFSNDEFLPFKITWWSNADGFGFDLIGKINNSGTEVIGYTLTTRHLNDENRNQIVGELRNAETQFYFLDFSVSDKELAFTQKIRGEKFEIRSRIPILALILPYLPEFTHEFQYSYNPLSLNLDGTLGIFRIGMSYEDFSLLGNFDIYGTTVLSSELTFNALLAKLSTLGKKSWNELKMEIVETSEKSELRVLDTRVCTWNFDNSAGMFTFTGYDGTEGTLKVKKNGKILLTIGPNIVITLNSKSHTENKVNIKIGERSSTDLEWKLERNGDVYNLNAERKIPTSSSSLKATVNFKTNAFSISIEENCSGTY